MALQDIPNWETTYEGSGNKLCGDWVDKTNETYHKFDIIEYEVFVVG